MCWLTMFWKYLRFLKKKNQQVPGPQKSARGQAVTNCSPFTSSAKWLFIVITVITACLCLLQDKASPEDFVFLSCAYQVHSLPTHFLRSSLHRILGLPLCRFSITWMVHFLSFIHITQPNRSTLTKCKCKIECPKVNLAAVDIYSAPISYSHFQLH